MDENIKFKTAIVGAVYTNGTTLIFPGQSTAGTKRYKGNKALALSPGDRVKITATGGTYLIDYIIGYPTAR